MDCGLYMSTHDSIASCMMLLDAEVWLVSWGMDYCLHPVRCSWVGMHKTACWTVSWGPAQLAMVRTGWYQSVFHIDLCVGWQCQLGCGVPPGLWSPLELVFPPLEWVLPPLEGALFVVPLGLGEPCCIWPWPLLPRFFAIVFLVNSLLSFCNASAVLLSVLMFCWSAIVRCWAAVTMWDSNETVGFVMYCCLKNTVSLICVTRVFATYTRKHRWCSIDVPRLSPVSDLMSHVRRSYGLMWAWIAQLRGVNGFFLCSCGVPGRVQKLISWVLPSIGIVDSK